MKFKQNWIPLHLWIEALNYTLLLLSSRGIGKKVTELSLLYIARTVWHRNTWFLTKTENCSFLSLWNNNTENKNDNSNILLIVNEESLS